MSHQEMDRTAIVQNVVEHPLTQVQAEAQLKLSVRQVKRLVRRYRQKGASGLAGCPPKHAFVTA